MEGGGEQYRRIKERVRAREKEGGGKPKVQRRVNAGFAEVQKT